MTCTTFFFFFFFFFFFDKSELFDLSQQSSDAETVPYAVESVDHDGGINVEILNDHG